MNTTYKDTMHTRLTLSGRLLLCTTIGTHANMHMQSNNASRLPWLLNLRDEATGHSWTCTSRMEVFFWCVIKLYTYPFLCNLGLFLWKRVCIHGYLTKLDIEWVNYHSCTFLIWCNYGMDRYTCRPSAQSHEISIHILNSYREESLSQMLSHSSPQKLQF